ncbi:MAG: heparinase II/III family protein [Planctomycetes bacterium]|nr:heparinase II/III family protein [Planctomycetota bacterium]
MSPELQVQPSVTELKLSVSGRCLKLTGRINPGIYRIDMTSREGLPTDRLFLSIEKLRQMENEPLQNLPSASETTGPWDQACEHMVVPWMAVRLDGEFLGRTWADLPGLDDLPAGRYRFSTGVEIEHDGNHEIAFCFPETESEIKLKDIVDVCFGPDERSPGPDMREMVNGREGHPQILLTPERLSELQSLSEGNHKKVIDAICGADPLPATEQTGQRGFFKQIETAALAAVIKEDEKRAAATYRGAELLMDLPYWGHCPNPHEMGHENDMSTGLNLYALVITYDWLHGLLETDRLSRLRETIFERARKLYLFSVLQRDYWPVGFAQNHMHAASLGLGVAGLLFMREDPEAKKWAVWVRSLYQKVYERYASDGSTPPLTDRYGMQFIVRYTEALKVATGINLFDHPQFRCFPAYVMATSGGPKGPSFNTALHALLSGEASVGGAYLRHQIDRRVERSSPEKLARNAVLALWYTGGRRETNHGFPACQYFPDGGIVTMRSGWFDGGPWFRLHCGPPGGHSVFHKMTRYDCAHYEPDAGSFVLHHGGQPVVVTPGGTYKKLTKHHNTLTINGHGQFSDGRVWSTLPPDGGYGEIQDFMDVPSYCRVSCNLAPAYPETTGLKILQRDVLFIKPHLFVFVDRSVTDSTASSEWWIHHPAEMEQVGEQTFRLPASDPSYLLRIFAPEEWSAEQSKTLVVRSYTNRSDVPAELCVKKPPGTGSPLFLMTLGPEGVIDRAAFGGEELHLKLTEADAECEGVQVGGIAVGWGL